jgi:hypothetical protein
MTLKILVPYPHFPNSFALMLNKVQNNYYAAGLHRTGSDAVFRYTFLEFADRNVLMKAAFDGSTTKTQNV